MKQRSLLRTGAAVLGAGLLGMSLSGCVVVPVPHGPPRGVVVVEPGYAPPPPWYRDRYDRRRDHRDWRY